MAYVERDIFIKDEYSRYQSRLRMQPGILVSGSANSETYRSFFTTPQGSGILQNNDMRILLESLDSQTTKVLRECIEKLDVSSLME